MLTQAQKEEVLQTIQYKDWRFSLDAIGNTLIVDGPIVDVYSGATTTLQNFCYLGPVVHTEESLISLVWKSICAAEMHESQEHFIVGDRRPYEPHNNKDVIPPFTGKKYSYPRYTDMESRINRGRWSNQRVGSETPVIDFFNYKISSITHS